MNQIKIGKFIAECRKDKNLTQEQLAEMLNTTNKSISKWENGNCLPDSSLYEPLCNILEITINELFAGKKIKDDDYKKVADENLMQMLKYKLYCLSDRSITFDEFGNALDRMSEVLTILKSFETREAAINFMMKETNLSFGECSNAYDFYINLYKID